MLGLEPRSIADVIPDQGRPARCLYHSAMASYESPSNKLKVLDAQIAIGIGSNLMIFPLSYLGPKTRLKLRPNLYYLEKSGWVRSGSQSELAWRAWIDDLSGQEQAQIEDKADQVLKEFLAPQQRLELAATNAFRVKGRLNTYRIRMGDGFEIVDPITAQKVVSFCLHPDYWLPEADIALATKLMLEDEELEVECLLKANRCGFYRTPKPSRREKLAADIERDLSQGS